ncbi:hypothetical protein DTO96_101493 [Ephemeroptericola cinctiostellae]|uniref:Pyridoxal phosphate homeostasis protein n=1 Tax=Ephemeroptericola cinctiostellae TaxID=2268024 RepID=A0A345DBL9_9BURK|nr:YggS family pyridoxal phosphate-dependent enzyme [Ephemeroptericola cinctiostellae]AXF85757.1 hypothetical protein DTO96_101493 [Ephemeroptericola cinctiostellae]
MSNSVDHPLFTSLEQQIRRITSTIHDACIAAQRSPDAVQLLAVTKTHPIETIQAAYALGLKRFGENYVQEGVDKIIALRGILPDNQAIWHFIGPLQSNKTRPVAEHFAWVHGIDRLKIAQRLSEQRPTHLPPLNVLIQVNISDESSKSGCAPDSALALALEIIQLPRLTLRGLMTIPAAIDPQANEATQCAPFVAMAQLHAKIKAHLPHDAAPAFDTLSMGMSDDYPHAIAAGSTLVRIGSALFGRRPAPTQTMTLNNTPH